MYKFLFKAAQIVLFPFIRVKVIGKENVPKDTGYVLASGHTSNWDPVILGFACPDELNFMAKKELFKNKILAAILRAVNAFPIDRGANDVRAIKTALRVLKDNKPLLIFPEGTRIKEKNHTADDAKNGMTMLAHRTHCPILPTAIVGEYKIFKTVTVVFGKPIYLDKYYDTKLDSEHMHEISARILQEIRKIGADTKKSLAKT